jgi:hypothetical protein
VKPINFKWLTAVPAVVLASGVAFAQDFTAGKTPAQLFSSDCSACHRSPDGIGKKYNIGSLTGFLRAHYTTKQESAGALAKYVMGFATLAPVRTTSPTAEDARAGDDPKGRRRSDVSGDGEKKPRSRTPAAAAKVEEPAKPTGAVAHPPAAVEAAVNPPAAPTTAKPAAHEPAAANEASPPTAKLNDYAHAGAPVVPQDAVADPLSRIRAYAVSGTGPLEAAAEAPKSVSGKPHHRAEAVPGDAAPPADEAAPTADVPDAAPAEAVPAAEDPAK